MAFTNRDRLRRRLKAIPVEVRKAAKAQNRANAEELVETIKRFAPPDESGALRASVKNQDVSTSTRIAQQVRAGGTATTKPVRESAKAPTYDYALAQEYGTAKMPANPFFWPSWRSVRKKLKARMTRAAKKAAREAVQK